MSELTNSQSFLTGNNALFLAELYARYLKKPEDIDSSWGAFFESLGDEESLILKEVLGASWTPRPSQNGKDNQVTVFPASSEKVKPFVSFPLSEPPLASREPKLSSPQPTSDFLQEARDSIRALRLIRAHRVRGHLMADLDPLKLIKPDSHPELLPETYGFTEKDMDRSFFVDGVLGRQNATLKEILTIVRETYCGHLGFEFMHIQEPEQKSWIQERIEADSIKRILTKEERLQVHKMLARADTYEKFLHVKYPGAKRFGLEGGEALIPALDQILVRASELEVDEILFGMAHRGRLNVLTNIIGKPFIEVFYEFQGDAALAEGVQGSGDVKYHLGTSVDREIAGRVMHLSLTPNPSHLEAVNPVVLGKIRAKQEHIKDKKREKIMGILLHGDAAFSGQGLVPETLSLSELDGYRTGGTLHIIINNQIGFTTNPNQSRSSPYCSDVAKMLQAPIIHVNGDDPEAMVYAARMAMDYKHAFKKDVIIDMFCYRRQGHNEMDEPAFTQPLMYKSIRSHPSTFDIYTERLVNEKIISKEVSDKLKKTIEDELQTEMDKANDRKAKEPDWLKGRWAGFDIARKDNYDSQSAVSLDILQKVGQALTQVPENFNLNPKLIRLFKAKEEMFKSGEGIDWATAEALAFGTLLSEGNSVRLSGQDCGRGTFSQRHAIWVDQETESPYIPLNNIQAKQGRFEVLNSPLSEAAVLGFDYGYSCAEPNHLVLWEAQFGDFANGAQMLIDQFIMSGEVKWFRMSGLVMLLPHGMEGQGPEHSSARLERFLQMCAEDNVQVANCTTPANYFHILRRQLRRNIRKPLILMTPKSLLRHKSAISTLKDMGPGSSFQRVIGEADSTINKDNINRIIVCSGKVYYDLIEEREKNKLRDVKIIRLEQLYPFPEKELREELKDTPHASVVWCQEEAKNNGAWFFVDRRIEAILTEFDYKNTRPLYAGRPEAASPATGYAKKHKFEQEKLVIEAFSSNQ